MSKIEHIIEPNLEIEKLALEQAKNGNYLTTEEYLDQIQKRPSSVSKIEAEKKSTLKRLKENEDTNLVKPNDPSDWNGTV